MARVGFDTVAGQNEEGMMIRNMLRVLRRFVPVALVLMGVLGLVGYLARAQDQKEVGTNLPPLTTTVIPPNNPLQVAILRWYGANLTTQLPVGTTPWGVAFDGANVWVVNNGSNTVSELRASDGSTLGTFPVGTSPEGMAFDGANIWVANFHSNNVTKLRASDGSSLGTFAVGTGPDAMAFDGANIWVTNFTSNNVTKL